MSHWQPLRFREKIVLRTSRMSTSRGRPPRGLCLAGGIIGPTIAHCSSVRSEGYFFRDWFSCTIDAHSSTDGICANYLINLLFCQVIFPDSLLVQLGGSLYPVLSTRSRAKTTRSPAPNWRGICGAQH